MYSLTLPDSNKKVKIQGYPLDREDEVLELQDQVADGKTNFKDLRNKIVEICYPDVDFAGATAADMAHLINMTQRYNIGGPTAVKNLIGSGVGLDQSESQSQDS